MYLQRQLLKKQNNIEKQTEAVELRKSGHSFCFYMKLVAENGVTVISTL